MKTYTICYLNIKLEFEEGLIEEYFEQLLLKTNYDTNDLLILHLYFLKCTLNAKAIDNVFENIYANILEQNNFSDANNIHLIQRVIVSIVLYHFNIEYYDLMPQTLSAVREIIDEIQDFALDYYNKAINGAELLNDKSFRDRVIEEKNKDFP